MPSHGINTGSNPVGSAKQGGLYAKHETSRLDGGISDSAGSGAGQDLGQDQAVAARETRGVTSIPQKK